MYWKEVRFRFYGDPETCRKYMHEGRQYLGQLKDQMDHGVIPTNSRKVTNAAGVEFIVSFFMGQPIIEIYAGVSSQGRGKSLVIDGFACYPSPNDLPLTAQDSVVVLMPPLTSGGEWMSLFFEPADFPASPDFPVNQFKRDASNRPLFLDGTLHADPGTGIAIPPHADGLTNFGNVDWRNQDESLIVSWVGPACRYMNAAVIVPWYSHYLFFHGQQIFDCSDLSAAGFFGDLSDYYNGTSPVAYGGMYGIITGACITPAFDLLVFVRFGAVSIGASGPTHGTIRKEFLIKLKVTPADARSVIGARASTWQLSGDGEPVILWSQELPSDQNDALHPWFFNQSANEARCIRTSGPVTAPTSADELVVAVAIGTDFSVTFDTISHAGASDVAITVTTDTFNAIDDGHICSTGNSEYQRPVFVCDTSTLISGDDFTPIDPTCYYADPGLTNGISDESHCWQGYASKSVGSDINAPVDDWIIAFVDFRDDVPVYGYTRVPDVNIVTDSEVDSITGSDAWTHVSFGGYPGTSTYDQTETAAFTVAKHGSTTGNSAKGGVMTDWATVEAFHSTDTVWHGNATFDLTETGHFESIPPPIPSALPGSCTYIGFTGTGADISATYTIDYSYVSTDHNRTIALLYLDLRYKWLCYGMQDTWTTLNSTKADSVTVTTTGIPTWTLSPVKETGTSEDYYATLDNVELAHTTVTVVDTVTTTGAGSGLPTSMDAGWMASTWFMFSTMVPVPTVGACEVGDISPTIFTATGHFLPVLGAGIDATSHDWFTALINVGNIDAQVIFPSFGSWQTYRGYYAMSQAMPDGADPTVANFEYRASDLTSADLKERLRAPDLVSMHPIWVLPKITY